MKTPGSSTLCIHAGNGPDPAGGVTTPIHTASSFRYLGGEGETMVYPRYMNIPTQSAVAAKLAALEGADEALVVASGMAAISGVLLALLSAGDHVVLQADAYGGTHHLAARELPRLGIESTFVAGHAADDFARALRPTTRVVYLETPANPLLSIVDLAAVAAMARAAGALTVCDNTFATPMNQRPLALGVDVVVHSGTKYLNGHSDLNCGAVAASRALMARIRPLLTSLGPTLNVYDCYLLERGMKTLALRMARHNANGLALARFLAGHGRVRRVFHPGLESHPGHAVAARQMAGFGGMLSFELDGTVAQAEAVMRRLRYIAPAVSLGGVESLACFPARTSHARMRPEERAAAGIGETLIRISAGVEDEADLLEDLRQALA